MLAILGIVCHSDGEHFRPGTSKIWKSQTLLASLYLSSSVCLSLVYTLKTPNKREKIFSIPPPI